MRISCLRLVVVAASASTLVFGTQMPGSPGKDLASFKGVLNKKYPNAVTRTVTGAGSPGVFNYTVTFQSTRSNSGNLVTHSTTGRAYWASTGYTFTPGSE